MRRLVAWLSWMWGYWRHERPAARRYDQMRGHHLPLDERARRAREHAAKAPLTTRKPWSE